MKKNVLILLIAVQAVAILLPYHPVDAVALDFDIHACYASCGCAHGLLYTCMECKAECDRKYWKAFDREMDDMTDDAGSSRRTSRDQK